MRVGGESEKVNLFLKFSNLYFSLCPPQFSFVPCPKNFPWEPERARVSFPFVFASLPGRKDTFPRFSLFSVSVGSGRNRAVARTRTVPNSGFCQLLTEGVRAGLRFWKGRKILLTSHQWVVACCCTTVWRALVFGTVISRRSMSNSLLRECFDRVWCCGVDGGEFSSVFRALDARKVWVQG